MKRSTRLTLALATAAAFLLLPLTGIVGAAPTAEPCEEGSTELCETRTYYYRKSARLSDQPGEKLAYDPDTVIMGWNGSTYHTSLFDLPEDFTFAAENSMRLELYRYATRDDTYTTLIEVRAQNVATGEEMILLPETAFVADVQAMAAEDVAVVPTVPSVALPDELQPTCRGHAFCEAVNDAEAPDAGFDGDTSPEGVLGLNPLCANPVDGTYWAAVNYIDKFVCDMSFSIYQDAVAASGTDPQEILAANPLCANPVDGTYLPAVNYVDKFVCDMSFRAYYDAQEAAGTELDDVLALNPLCANPIDDTGFAAVNYIDGFACDMADRYAHEAADAADEAAAEEDEASEDAEMQENWNVITLDFGEETTVPAGWDIQIRLRTLVGDGHVEEPYLQDTSSSRTNPDAYPRPSFLYRQESPDFPTKVDFRLVTE